MVLGIRDSGKRIKQMDLGDSCMSREMFMKVCGKMRKPMAMAYLSVLVPIGIMDNG